jgi:hypothetical protein
VSSRKLQAGTKRGEEGKARETRLCLMAEGIGGVVAMGDDVEGNGAVKENVDDDGGAQVKSFGFDMGMGTE